MSIIGGWAFLISALFMPMVLSRSGSIRWELQLAVCCACSLGLALTAFRLRRPKPIAATVLAVITILLISSVFYDWARLLVT